MAKAKQFQEIQALTEMLFSSRSAEVQAISARQAELRGQLHRLAEQENIAQDRFAEDIQLRLSRADVVWQTWLGCQKSALNTELARVSAEKERQMQGLRQAFGRREVANQLVQRVKARQTF
jgi:hypothetical protein